jgi:FkbM family methyltransferase
MRLHRSPHAQQLLVTLVLSAPAMGQLWHVASYILALEGFPPMIPPLCALLRPQRLTEIVDIGANPTAGGDPPYKSMLETGLCRLTGFEPHEEALAQLLQKKGPNERYLPFVVGDGNSHTFNICWGSTMSGLFEVDPVMLDLFPEFIPWTRLVRQVAVATHKLDDIDEIKTVDFLKIDTQGSELAVFRSGKRKLAQTVAVQTEVAFMTLYKEQPTIGDVDVELRLQGFVPHCLNEIKKWPISPHVFKDNPWETQNQLLEADIVYVRNFAHHKTMTDEQLKHLALIAHYCYGSFDLALCCVMLLEQREALEVGAQQAYRSLIMKS